jgi:hypothetical protein
MSEMTSKHSARVRILWICLVTTWVGCVGIGFAALIKYSSTPGPQAKLPSQWPALFPFRPQKQGITLVLSLHPQCPCSRATVGELERLMTMQASGVRAFLLMVKPVDAPDNWEITDLWNQTRHIPGVVVMLDRNGAYSNLFGAKTSGHVYAFDSTGRALFSGGITRARGHMGDSAGGDAVTDLLCGRTNSRTTAPVFGCPLQGPSDLSASGAIP